MEFDQVIARLEKDAVASLKRGLAMLASAGVVLVERG
jgi:hypothetical protein